MKASLHLFRIILLAALLATTVLSIKPVTSAHAEDLVITVNTEFDSLEYTPDLCTLREAIINANDDAATYPDCAAGSGDDTILFGNNIYNAILLLKSDNRLQRS